jgi:endo-beta-N-acetylglucosaminidase D
MRLGASAASYYGFLVSGTSSSSTVTGTNRDNLDRMFYLGGSSGAGQAITLSVDVINPFASLYTQFLNGIYLDGNQFGTMQGQHRVATSYTAFEMLIGTGTMTGGTIRVYGYRN